VDAFPQTKPQENWETNNHTPEVIPQKQELTMFWGEISSLDPAEQELVIMQTIVPYEQGTFLIGWHGQGSPQHEYSYKFLGVERDQDGNWHYRLENTELADRYKHRPEALRKIQSEFGVIYPTFPLNHKFSSSNGGPTEIWLILPDEM
jgi:hypothetical protein